ncbi:MAG: ISAs1 family transposase [Deltaproteobacteria bacterium]|nr:ISAs1 family transposase [Deltaproteobacteria bacterium]
MNSLENATLVDHFSRIPDFRCKHNKRHKLVDIMVITICAVIGGANDWNAIETFGNAKIAWLQTFLELPNGIPSHDTFRRIFSILSPKIFQDCLYILYRQKDLVEVLELNVQVDHVHLIVSIPPKYSVSAFMGFLKGKIALRLFQKYDRVGKKFWGRHFLVSWILCKYCWIG